jgi:hypothetical protein
MGPGLLSRVTVLCSISLVLASAASAADEQVFIRKVVCDKAIAVRGNQEFYLIQTSPQCRCLAGYQGKTVLVRSPKRFLGANSRLVLVGIGQQCRIAYAAALGVTNDSIVLHRPESDLRPDDRLQGLMAVQEALMLLGRDPGIIGVETGTMKVLDELRKQYGNEASLVGLKKTIQVLALQVISHNPNDARAKEVARKLLNMALAPDSDSLGVLRWRTTRSYGRPADFARSTQ